MCSLKFSTACSNLFARRPRIHCTGSPTENLFPAGRKARREDAAESIRISRTICRQVMEAKEALLSADAANDQRF